MDCWCCSDLARCHAMQVENYALQRWAHAFARPECKAGDLAEHEPGSGASTRRGITFEVYQALEHVGRPMDTEEIRHYLGITDFVGDWRRVNNALTRLVQAGQVRRVGMVRNGRGPGMGLWALAEATDVCAQTQPT